jgi:DNA polymerase
MSYVVEVHDFASFREAARGMLAAGVPPSALTFRDLVMAQGDLFASAPGSSAPPPASGVSVCAPRRFVTLAGQAAYFRASDRFALLYRVLHRLGHESPRLFDDELDDDVRTLVQRAQRVRQDEHRMHGFVRFRRIVVDDDERFVAWYRPEHLIVRLAAPFFARRFASMNWAILTPDERVSWDGEALHYGPGAGRSEAPDDDELEQLFRTYYRATYNPARRNDRLFGHHVPTAFRRDLPELTGPVDVEASRPPVQADAAAPLVPARRDLTVLREAAAKCDACPLGAAATQTVFGEGAPQAKLCLIGEQPGDEEDRRGRPFIGPAGKVLARALDELGIARHEVYLTNAVKHFNYRPVGKKRLHQKPEWQHVEACRPWLRAELEAVKPAVIVCLGATAAQSFLGRRFTVLKNRGRVFDTPWAKAFLVTYHPSAILRMPTDAARDEAFAALRDDLALATRIAAGEVEHLRQL